MKQKQKTKNIERRIQKTSDEDNYNPNKPVHIITN